jgi:hypothetical protein
MASQSLCSSDFQIYSISVPEHGKSPLFSNMLSAILNDSGKPLHLIPDGALHAIKRRAFKTIVILESGCADKLFNSVGSASVRERGPSAAFRIALELKSE